MVERREKWWKKAERYERWDAVGRRQQAVENEPAVEIEPTVSIEPF